jgi:hypothetical protein
LPALPPPDQRRQHATCALRDRVRLEDLIEAFNLTKRAHVVTVNGNFGAGLYPSTPTSTFVQATAATSPAPFNSVSG